MTRRLIEAMAGEPPSRRHQMVQPRHQSRTAPDVAGPCRVESSERLALLSLAADGSEEAAREVNYDTEGSVLSSQSPMVATDRVSD